MNTLSIFFTITVTIAMIGVATMNTYIVSVGALPEDICYVSKVVPPYPPGSAIPLSFCHPTLAACQVAHNTLIAEGFNVIPCHPSGQFRNLN